MDETTVKEKLLELCKTIARSPSPDHASKVTDGMYISHEDSRGNVIETSLEALRLQVKYLLFDLEATRRENRYLRRMLETRPKPGADETHDDGPSQF